MKKNLRALRYIPSGSTHVTRDGLDADVYTSVGPDGTGYAIAYKGNSKNHVWNYSFRKPEHREKTIENFFKGVESINVDRAARREERKAAVNTFKVGDILHYSWGYDQTNAEFFQVVSITQKSATIRRISSAHAGATSHDSENVVAIKDAFLDGERGEPMRKRSYGGGLGMEFGSATLWSGKPVHNSWGH